MAPAFTMAPSSMHGEGASCASARAECLLSEAAAAVQACRDGWETERRAWAGERAALEGALSHKESQVTGLTQETKRLARVTTEANQERDKARHQWKLWRQENGALREKHKRLQAETARLLKLNKAMRDILEREIIRREPSSPPPAGGRSGDGDGKCIDTNGNTKHNTNGNNNGGGRGGHAGDGDGAAKVDVVGSTTPVREEAVDLTRRSATLAESLQSAVVFSNARPSPPQPPSTGELAGEAVDVSDQNRRNDHGRRRDREYSSADEVTTPRVSAIDAAAAGARRRGRSVEADWRAAEKNVEGGRSMTRRDRGDKRVPGEEAEGEREDAEPLDDTLDPRGCIAGLEEPTSFSGGDDSDDERARMRRADGYVCVYGNGDGACARVRGLFGVEGDSSVGGDCGVAAAGVAAAGSGRALPRASWYAPPPPPPSKPAVTASEKGVHRPPRRRDGDSSNSVEGGRDGGGDACDPSRETDGNGNGNRSARPADVQLNRSEQRVAAVVTPVMSASSAAAAALDRRSNPAIGSSRRRAQSGLSSSGRKRARLELDEKRGGDIVVTEVPEAPRQRSARRAAHELRRETTDGKLSGGVSVRAPSSSRPGGDGGVGREEKEHGSDSGWLHSFRPSTAGAVRAEVATFGDRGGFEVEGVKTEKIQQQQQQRRGLSCGVGEKIRSAKLSTSDELPGVRRGRHARNLKQETEEADEQEGGEDEEEEDRKAPPRSGVGQPRTPTGRGGRGSSAGSRSTSNERRRDADSSRGHVRPRPESHTSPRRKHQPPLAPVDGGSRTLGAVGGGGGVSVGSDSVSVSVYAPLALAAVSPKKSSRSRRHQQQQQQQQQERKRQQRQVEPAAGNSRSSSNANNSGSGTSTSNNNSNSNSSEKVGNKSLPDAAAVSRQNIGESNQNQNQGKGNLLGPLPRAGHGRRQREDHRARATVANGVVGGDDGRSAAPSGAERAVVVGAVAAPGSAAGDAISREELGGRHRTGGDGSGGVARSRVGDGGSGGGGGGDGERKLKVSPSNRERPGREEASLTPTRSWNNGTGKAGIVADTRSSPQIVRQKCTGDGAPPRTHVNNPYGSGGLGGGGGGGGGGRGMRASVDMQRPPKMYTYQEVVRNRAKRATMKGHDCEHCAAYIAVVGGSPGQQQAMMNMCSRHKHNEVNGRPAETPEGFWDLSFADSAKEQRQ